MRIYPYYLDVTNNPDYTRRPVRVLSWDDLGGNTQFFIELVHAQKDGVLFDLERELDLYIDRHHLGTIMAPYAYNLFADNLDELVAAYRQRGLFIAHIWGFVPQVNPEIGWGHLNFTSAIRDALERGLGRNYLGIGNGEQDGRYFGQYAPAVCPAPLERKEQYWQFHRFARRLICDLGGKTTDICSLSSGYYFLREGHTTVTQAETAQALPNAQVYYAMLRGAGKRFGVLWSAGDSVFNKWGFKGYSLDEASDQIVPGYGLGPEKGTSLALLKRLTWLHILHNVAFTGFEINYIVGDSLQERAQYLEKPDDEGKRHVLPIDYARPQLSPIGRLQAEAREIVSGRVRAGVHLAPLAIVLDYFSGWAMPRHLYSASIYKVWGNIPYNQGDYLTHLLLDMLYPGYTDSGFYHDERGFIAPTPYGDIADILLSDAPAECYKQYDTVVLAGDLTGMLPEIEDKLREYVSCGGRLVLTAANAAGFSTGLTGVQFTGELKLFERQAEITAPGMKIIEPLSFELNLCSLSEKAEVLASCESMPLYVRHPYGNGFVLTLLSPHGIQKIPSLTGAIENLDDKPLADPYSLTEAARYLFAGEFKRLQLFEAGGGLSVTAARRSPNHYEVLLLNNELAEKPFRIVSHVGAISEIREVRLGSDLSGERGYRPGGFEKAALGDDTAQTIAGLSARLFEVTVVAETAALICEINLGRAPQGLSLSFGQPVSLEREIMLRPSFLQHYDGVKVSWRYFASHESAWLQEEIKWLTEQPADLSVDFTDGLNGYPDLVLSDSFPELWAESRAAINRIFDKMAAAGVKDAVFSPSITIPGKDSPEEQQRLFIRIMTILARDAAERAITIHMQIKPGRQKWSSITMLEMLRSAGQNNLRFCLNTAHSLLIGEDPVKILELAGDCCGMILLSTPGQDEFGQNYDAHLPLSGSPFAPGLSELIRAGAGQRLVLDAAYSQEDDEYRDAAFIEKIKNDRI
ncbi:MAG TPA: hypothetical protein DD640_05340 [Clostridiales bacterium]|nr:hypothetical protein [Clostridiales bacterium]